jgi:methyl-accepting chemotaxis protein
MTTRVLLSLLEIAVLVGTLAIFLNIVARQLNRICSTLAKITFGVRAVEQMVENISPNSDRLNASLSEVSSALNDVAGQAERLAR